MFSRLLPVLTYLRPNSLERLEFMVISLLYLPLFQILVGYPKQLCFVLNELSSGRLMIN